MPRKKKGNVEVNNEDNGEIVYCGQRHCPHRACLRHNVNTPFNVVIRRRTFSPDKDWNCKDILED